MTSLDKYSQLRTLHMLKMLKDIAGQWIFNEGVVTVCWREKEKSHQQVMMGQQIATRKRAKLYPHLTPGEKLNMCPQNQVHTYA